MSLSQKGANIFLGGVVMAQYTTFDELVQAEPHVFEPLYEWLESVLYGIAEGVE